VLLFNFGMSILSGSLTLALLVLPVVITASEEALRTVPQSFRQASIALGATKWQTVRGVVLPAAIPGIITGLILGIGRAAGETAPILFTAAAFYLPTLPRSVFDPVMALPYHIYVVSSKIPQNEYTERVQYGAAFVFLALVMLIALTSIILRERTRNRLSW
jgi:phosphate transport system permease protein